MRTLRKGWAPARIGAPFFVADHPTRVTNLIPMFAIGPNCGDVTEHCLSSSPTSDPTGSSQWTCFSRFSSTDAGIVQEHPLLVTIASTRPNLDGEILTLKSSQWPLPPRRVDNSEFNL
jgi:hypothetical protein